MNFKLQKIKGIVSVVIPLIPWTIIIIIARSNMMLVNVSPIIANILNMHDVGNILSIGNIYIFLLEACIVYLILSLLQKRSLE